MDGRAVELRVQGSILYGADGLATRILGNCRNITIEKRQNEGFTRARALEAVGQMTGGIAHDFNNLLMIIQLNAELLQLSQLSPENANAVNHIMQASEAASSLTRRLLSFSGQSELDTASLDLNLLLADVVELLRSGLTERISLSFAAVPDLWVVEVDGRALEQAIINLAVNASDALVGLEGGKIELSCENVVVSDDMVGSTIDLANGRYVCINVSDNGSGMTREVMSKAFEPFFTTKEVGKGTGLGLSSVYGFAKQSGGAVTIYSEPGHGTTVKLYLPVIDGDEVEVQAGESICESSDPVAARILVVEDHPDLRDHVEVLLVKSGFRVEVAGDAAAALALLEKDRDFDLLFTDIIMPGGLDGVQLAETVRRGSPHIRILLTSGFPAGALDGRGMDKRFEFELLRKPYRSTELIQTIMKLLGQQG